MQKTLRQGAKRLCIGAIDTLDFATVVAAVSVATLIILILLTIVDILFLPVRVASYGLTNETSTSNAQDVTFSFLETCVATALVWLVESVSGKLESWKDRIQKSK